MDLQWILVFFRFTKKSSLHEFQTEIWIQNKFRLVLSLFRPLEESNKFNDFHYHYNFLKGNYLGFSSIFILIR